MRRYPLIPILITGLSGALLVLTLLAPHIPPSRFWPAIFAAYLFNWLLPVQIVLLVYWLRPPRVPAWIPALLLLLCVPDIHRHIRMGSGSPPEREGPTLVVATLNTYSLRRLVRDKPNSLVVDRSKSALLFPKDMAPDILCLQEVPMGYQPVGPDWGIGHSYLFRHKNSLIVSRFPLKNKQKKSFKRSGNSIAWADVETPLGLIRIFNVHLQSNRISQDADRLAEAPIDDAGTWTGVRGMLRKVRASTRLREEQARWLSGAIRDSPIPVVVAGDFNDTPQSYAYHIIRQGLDDSFEHGGFGFGTTFAGRIPGLRIDFLLASTGLTFLDHTVAKGRFSDHYPVLARLTGSPASAP